MAKSQTPAKHLPIVIIGGGAWGLSTALHLLDAGHTNVTVFEQASSIPSQYSAAYDLNKIVRAEYEDEYYTELALQAMKKWKTPLWGPYFHQTGYVVATSDRAPQKAIDHLHHALANIKEHPSFAPSIKSLQKYDDFKDVFWQFTGPMTGFKGYLNRHAGYAHSAGAMKGIHKHLSGRGVKFVLGPDHGKVTQLLHDSKDSPKKCTGVKTADGRTHPSALTICCLGPFAAKLIPKVGAFTVAKSWSVAHVQLTQEECDYLRGIPVLNMRDLGFFFEPDPETKLFKLCPLGAGFVNTEKSSGNSIPPAGEVPVDYIPAEDEAKLRRLLQQTLPWMADRPFVQKKMMWFSDTADSEYLVDFVPNTDKSVIMLSGDSGHGFKMMPVAGEWVMDLLKEGQQKRKGWQWRPETNGDKNWGEKVSWRIGTTKEIQTVIDEQGRMLKARL